MTPAVEEKFEYVTIKVYDNTETMDLIELCSSDPSQEK